MDLESFISRWSGQEGGAERANYALFLSEFCDVLGLPRPDPAGATTARNDYVFERAVRRADGTFGRIDLYRRDCFVLEAKQSRQKPGGDKFVDDGAPQADLLKAEVAPRGRRFSARGWDVLMLNARRQAEDYARFLPQDHGWPPFVIVCDVGHCLEIYADFRRMGKYDQFPDRQNFRVFLDDLRRDEVRERLRAVWLDPHSLDPARKAARATRAIAERLALVSRSLEARGYDAEEVAHFLMRCLFTMFAEDVGLLPKQAFHDLLQDCLDNPAAFGPLLEDLWGKMDQGGFAPSIRAAVRRFNGALFRDAKVLALARAEIAELVAAAQADWREVEPAIFGTLLEQALDPAERAKLGAHYTPRPHVERLVTATIIEPLRADWANVLAAAEAKRAAGDLSGAAALVADFHRKLCAMRVLDPACGTGNFLYVSLELMKRLEGEVLEAFADLGGQEALALEGHTVDPKQFFGLELNPRAAAIAELVLWIGFLQWHFRTKGGAPGEPILKAFGNIRVQDAVLTWDGYPAPKVVEREGKRIEVLEHPRRPVWPEAEFIVGNPPFIGGKDLRARLGSLYTEALWAAHRHINNSADYVMYWWDRAAEILAAKGSPLRRFGLVTTNSITQEFSRRVIKKRLEADRPISLVMAIPDHPWTKATRDAAAVRIAMTVAEAGAHDGVLREVETEAGLDTDAPEVQFAERIGRINPDFTVGVDVTATVPLRANEGLCSPGVKLHGAGFIVTAARAEELGLGRRPGLERHIRPYRNGRDLTARPRGVLVIDLFGLSADEVRQRFPEIYQHLLATVKPERDENNRATYRENWWVFGEPRAELRPALDGLTRYIVTVETMRHRAFLFLEREILPDNMLVCIGSDNAWLLAILSSRIHTVWALAAGGWQGVGNDPRYSKSKVFDPFPFPDPPEGLKAELRTAGEELDAFRKARQAEHPDLTLTQIYNVRAAIRAGRALTTEEERIRDSGLVLILNELHDRIDSLAFAAYGWPEDLTDEKILARLVSLNRERAAEERRGLIRWLRPDYQQPRASVASVEAEQTEAALVVPEGPKTLPAFPKEPVERFAAVAAILASAGGPLDAAAIAARFKRDRRLSAAIAEVLSAFVRTGAVSSPDGGRIFALRRAA